MGYIVIKPSPDRDEYVYWSTIVEAPIMWGDRAGMLAYLQEEHDNAPLVTSEPGPRLDRADRYGSSALDGTFRWDDQELIYEQRGYLARKDLYRACLLLGEDRESEVWDLMTPFEDEAGVRRG